MNATAILLLLIGIFILINAPNFVGVLQGNTKISFAGSTPTTTTTGTAINSVPTTNTPKSTGGQ